MVIDELFIIFLHMKKKMKCFKLVITEIEYTHEVNSKVYFIN